jgi:indolepyruvate ferredoxin oxidoreductase beta subunit
MGLNSKQSEVHGMSQRGGPVFAFVRISDEVIYSDLIPSGEADLILGLEPMEALRYTQYLKKDGMLIVDQNPIKIDNYDEDAITKAINEYPNHILLNADKIAKEVGNPLGANMVLGGVASPFLKLEESYMKASIRTLFGRKSEKIVESNIMAFDKGAELGMKFQKELVNS